MASTKTKKAPAKKKTTKANATSTRAKGSSSTKKAPAKKAAAKKTTAQKKTPAKKVKKVWKSRAVVRMVEPGSQVDCVLCGERVKFQAKMRHQQAICNIYEKSKWVRVDHYHLPCYEEAGEPYGPAES